MIEFDVQNLSAITLPWIVSGVLALGLGYGAGLLHFRSLKGVVRRMLAGDRTALLIQLARLIGLGGGLWLLALLGAHALLAAAAGLLLARSRVLARVGDEL